MTDCIDDVLRFNEDDESTDSELQAMEDVVRVNLSKRCSRYCSCDDFVRAPEC